MSNERSEATPLLPSTEELEEAIIENGEGSVTARIRTDPTTTTTPLPKKQLFVLCCMRFAEPISLTVIFPFVNEMIQFIGTTDDPSAVGYYSGFLEGTFSLTQFCTVFFWGNLSDHIGRRPVLLIGLLGCGAATFCFGFSQSFVEMVMFRGLIGILDGNIAVMKSMIGEITDETNQGRAFSFVPLCWALGSIIAPILGGFLSHPASRLSLFKGSKLFERYPYALPCICASFITGLALIIGFVFLEESLHTKRGPGLTKHLRKSSLPVPALPPSSPAAQRLTARAILSDRRVTRVLVSTIFMALASVSIDNVFVLWLYTPAGKGGVGFSPSEIGIALSFRGIASTFVVVTIFPPLQRRFGTAPIYRAAMSSYLLVILLFPLITLIAAGGRANDTVVRLGVALMLMIKVLGGMIFACNMILLNTAAPSRNVLGKLNGISQMVASSMRAIGPALASSLFALTQEKHYLGGNLIWIYMLFITTFGAICAFRVY